MKKRSKRTEFASKGGQARASVLTPQERQEIARAAAVAKWRKEKGASYRPPEPEGATLPKGTSPLVNMPSIPYSMLQGKLQLGGMDLECHVLNDGRRVFTQREMVRLITGGAESGNLQRYLTSIGFGDNDLLAGQAIRFRIPQNPTISIGSEVTLLIEICEQYLKARDAGTLRRGQLHLARQSEIITRACAKVGIIALVDEATGYQKIREKQALQLKLQAFIAEDIQEWAQMFPDEFWLELARLEGVRYSPRSRPLRWGKYIMMFVYDAIDKDIGKKLREINPNPHFQQNHHQWLKEFGRDKVNNQIQRVITVMKLCENMDEFRQKFARVFKKSPWQLSFNFGDTPGMSAG